MRRKGPVLLIHGGTGSRPDRRRSADLRRSLRAVCDDAYRYLQVHDALEGVAYAVRRLEDDPLFNAGTGSVLQGDGKARMSASIMDGATQRFAAVLNIERVRNPVAVSRALWDERHRILAGAGALRFARSRGFRPWNPVTKSRARQWHVRKHTGHGTVGAVALDVEGRLAAATSTGGGGFEWPGRVSDSGTPAGNYANRDVAISCTGVGEDIVDEGLALRIAQRTSDGATIRQAFERTFRELRASRRQAGAIGLGCRGQLMWQTLLPVLLGIGQTPSRRLETW